MQTKEIKQKIRAVQNIRKITKTMEMVSAAKMKKTTTRALGGKEFALRALSLLVNLSKEATLSHPYLEPHKGDKTLVIIVGSNKGLCGAYNTNLNRSLASYLGGEDTSSFEAITIGKQAERIASRNSLSIRASFVEFSDYLTLHDISTLSSMIKESFLDSRYHTVLVAFTEFIKPLTYKPMVRQLLPLEPHILLDLVGATDDEREALSHKDYLSLYQLEPSEGAILESVVPSLLTSVLYQTILDSYASEHSSRMVAMKGATDNATSLLDDLQLSYNKARQESITREIAEISAGAQAV